MSTPPILEVGLFVFSLEAKTGLFNDYFVWQCSFIDLGSTPPAFRPRCSTLLKSFNEDGGNTLNSIRSLDAKKVHGCDDISNLMKQIRAIEEDLFCSDHV